jgi:heme exporter protein D
MGGYGFFVWLSFGSTALLLAGLHLYSRWQRQHFIRQLHAKIAREARIQQHQSES